MFTHINEILFLEHFQFECHILSFWDASLFCYKIKMFANFFKYFLQITLFNLKIKLNFNEYKIL